MEKVACLATQSLCACMTCGCRRNEVLAQSHRVTGGPRNGHGVHEAGMWLCGGPGAAGRARSVRINDRRAHACRGFVEVVLEMFLQGISLSEMEAMMAVARLESGGQLVGDLDADVMLSWAAMVVLTLQAIGLPMTASGVLSSPPLLMLLRPFQ